MKKLVWFMSLIIIEATIASNNFCLNVRNEYYQEVNTVNIKNINLSVLTPKYQLDRLLIKKEECLNRLLIVKKGKNIIYLNNKAILNNIDYQQDPFQLIRKEDSGISIIFEFGSVNYASFIFSFKLIKDKFQLKYKKYSFFNKQNSEIYIKGIDFFQDKSVFLKNFKVLDYIEIPIIPLTLSILEKEIKRKKYVKYYNINYLESILFVKPLTIKTLTRYNNIAYYLQKANANKEAIYLLEKIIEKYPSRTVAHYNIADAYWDIDDKKNAIKHYNIYIKQMKEKGKEKRIPKKVLQRVSVK